MNHMWAPGQQVFSWQKGLLTSSLQQCKKLSWVTSSWVCPFIIEVIASVFWDILREGRVKIQWLDCLEILSEILVHAIYISCITTMRMVKSYIDLSGSLLLVSCLGEFWHHRMTSYGWFSIDSLIFIVIKFVAM